MDPTKTSPAQAQQIRSAFAALAGAPDGALDLIEAALLIGAEAQPHADLDAARRTLAELVRAAPAGLTPGAADANLARALCAYLHGAAGFHGNRSRYDEPENSYLHCVLDRRAGIPITLALLYLHVGRARGLRVRGIGFPGHFLVGIGAVQQQRVIVDPFSGVVLEPAAIAALAQRYGVPAQGIKGALQPAPDRMVLVRVLHNLLALHQRAGAPDAALACCERILLLTPDNAPQRRVRAALYEQMGIPTAAAQDLAWLLARERDAGLRNALRQKLAELARTGRPTVH